MFYALLKIIINKKNMKIVQTNTKFTVIVVQLENNNNTISSYGNIVQFHRARWNQLHP